MFLGIFTTASTNLIFAQVGMYTMSPDQGSSYLTKTSPSFVCALPSRHGLQTLADFRHLPNPECPYSCSGSIRKQNHPSTQQILSLLPPDRMVGRSCHCGCMCTHPSRHHIRLQDLDQQYWLEQQWNLLHHRPRQPTV